MERIRWFIPVAVVALATPAWAAQTDRPGPPDGANGSPSLGVARVSLADGDVTVQHGKSGDWEQARSGRPLVAGDRIATGRSSRAEVHVGPGNFIRLSGESELRIGDLGNRRYQVDVVKGIITYSELRGGDADIDIDTPQAIVRPMKNGVYRVEVLNAGQTNITVRKGEAEVASSTGMQKLKKGRRMTVRGEKPHAEFRVAKAEPKDSFDRWNNRRDELLKTERGSYSGWWWPHHLGFGFGYGFGPYGFYGPGPGLFVRTSYHLHGRGHRGRGRH